MYKALFTNSVKIPQKKELVKEFLSNPENLLKWDSDISIVEKTNIGVKITRVYQSLNDSEIVTIENGEDTIIYDCKGNRLDYRVEFKIIESSEFIELFETLFLREDTNAHLPLKLLKPVVKYAFSLKLDNLTNLLEQI